MRTGRVQRLGAFVAAALVAVAVAAPSSLAVPVDPFEGTAYHLPKKVIKKKTRKAPRRPECRNNRHLYSAAVGCPVAG